jgi:hypothetical protein
MGGGEGEAAYAFVEETTRARRIRRDTRRTPLVLKIPVDISEAKTLFELARQEGGE